MPEKKLTQAAQLLLMRRDLDGILEYVKEIREDLKEHNVIKGRVASAENRIDNLSIASTKFITHDQFWPVKVIVFGAVGLILTAVIGSLMAAIIARGSP